MNSPFRHRRGYWVAFFHDEAYNVTIHLLWGVTGPKFKSYAGANFPGNDVDDTDDWCGRHAHFQNSDKGYDVHVIALQQWRGRPEDYAVLVHECLHATRSVLHSRGIAMKGPGEEAYCYFLDSLVRRCLQQIRKAK